MGISLYVIYCLSLAAFNICSLCLIFIMSWCVSLWVYPIWDSLHFQDLAGYLLSHVWENFDYNLLKLFSHILSYFSSYSCTPIIQMLLGLMFSQRSLRLYSFLFYSFFLYSLLLQLFPALYFPAQLFILLLQLFCHCFPLVYFWISVIVLFIVDCQFFNSFCFLLNISFGIPWWLRQ